MAQPETGGVRTTEGEGDKLETPSDDEEITIPSKTGLIYGMLISLVNNHKIHNEKTGCYLRSPGMGLTHNRLVRSTLRQRKIQYSGPSVCRQEGGLICKRKFSHLRGGPSGP